MWNRLDVGVLAIDAWGSEGQHRVWSGRLWWRRGDGSIVEYLILSLIGLAAGLAGGLLGIGGSIVMIPAMTELLGEQQHLYQAAALIVNFCVVVPATYQHMKARAVMIPMVKGMVPAALVGVLVGVSVSELGVFRGSGQFYLIAIFGLFLLYVSVYNLHRLLRPRLDNGDDAPVKEKGRWKVALLAGLPTGIASGLLGVGGGVVAVPLQNRVFGIPLRNAIANSATTIIALSVLGACTKNYALAVGHPEYTVLQSVTLAAILAPTAIVGSLIGSKLVHVLPVRVIRIAFIAFLFVASARMIYRGIAGFSGTGEHEESRITARADQTDVEVP